LFFLAFLMLSCQDNRGNLEKLESIYRNNSIKQITAPVYNEIYRQAKDSLKNWVDVGLKNAMNLKINTWQMDSLICFNKNKDKFIAAISVQLTKYTDTDHDGMYFFYGVKIKKQWYFFYGPYIVIPRDEDSLNPPTSFTKLHEIAMQEVFSGYLKRKDLGFWRNVFGKTEYEVNEAFFNQLDYSKWGFIDKEGNVVDNSKLSQAQLDSHLLAKAVYDKWNYRDTTHYKPVP